MSRSGERSAHQMRNSKGTENRKVERAYTFRYRVRSYAGRVTDGATGGPATDGKEPARPRPGRDSKDQARPTPVSECERPPGAAVGEPDGKHRLTEVGTGRMSGQGTKWKGRRGTGSCGGENRAGPKPPDRERRVERRRPYLPELAMSRAGRAAGFL